MKLQDGSTYYNAGSGKEVNVAIIPRDFSWHPEVIKYRWVMPIFRGDDGSHYDSTGLALVNDVDTSHKYRLYEVT